MTYEDLRDTIHRALDRDGQHGWDETARLAEVVAAAVWNQGWRSTAEVEGGNAALSPTADHEGLQRLSAYSEALRRIDAPTTEAVRVLLAEPPHQHHFVLTFACRCGATTNSVTGDGLRPPGSEPASLERKR